MKTLIIAVAIIAMLLVAACGGNIQTTDRSPTIAPQEQALSYDTKQRRDISYEGRTDYKEAMHDNCQKRDNGSYCSLDGRGWFVRWLPSPTQVVIPDPKFGYSTRNEDDIIRRAVAIVNRSLPLSKRLKVTYTNHTASGIHPDNFVIAHRKFVVPGAIHAEILPYDAAPGLGWTNGRNGFAVVREDLMTDPEYAVQTMVHEIMHALGLMGHPHHTHTSVLSYRHESTEILDNIPLIDVAVLYEMNEWSYWSGEIDTVFDTSEGVQFGVHDVDGFRKTLYGFRHTLIPWVDAGYMPSPQHHALQGTATWTGTLVGKTAWLAEDLHGIAQIRVNFDNLEGYADFHTITRWDGTMWNQNGWTYDIYVNGPYFDSDDLDGIPDVTGAFYGTNGEIAAGTLQRTEITAAFGAQRN